MITEAVCDIVMEHSLACICQQNVAMFNSPLLFILFVCLWLETVNMSLFSPYLVFFLSLLYFPLHVNEFAADQNQK